MSNRYARLAILLAALVTARAGWSQTISQRGFVEARGTGFAQEAPNDPTRAVADLLVREEVFVRPAPWLRFAAGADLRANSHDQVEDCWRIDFTDRGRLRPRVSIRRAAVTISKGPLTIDVGKQFIRWGKTDIVTPTDRFAPAISSTSSRPSSWPSPVPARWRKPAIRTRLRLPGCRG